MRVHCVRIRDLGLHAQLLGASSLQRDHDRDAGAVGLRVPDPQ